MTTNLQTISPLQQIKIQNLELHVDTDSKKYFEEELTLFADEQISIDVNIELNIEFNPDWGRSVSKVKVHFLNGYNNRECEDLILHRSEILQLENFLSNSLIIELN